MPDFDNIPKGGRQLSPSSENSGKSGGLLCNVLHRVMCLSTWNQDGVALSLDLGIL